MAKKKKKSSEISFTPLLIIFPEHRSKITSYEKYHQLVLDVFKGYRSKCLKTFRWEDIFRYLRYGRSDIKYIVYFFWYDEIIDELELGKIDIFKIIKYNFIFPYLLMHYCVNTKPKIKLILVLHNFVKKVQENCLFYMSCEALRAMQEVIGFKNVFVIETDILSEKKEVLQYFRDVLKCIKDAEFKFKVCFKSNSLRNIYE